MRLVQDNENLDDSFCVLQYIKKRGYGESDMSERVEVFKLQKGYLVRNIGNWAIIDSYVVQTRKKTLDLVEHCKLLSVQLFHQQYRLQCRGLLEDNFSSYI